MNFTIQRWIYLTSLIILAILVAIGWQHLQPTPTALTNLALIPVATEIASEPIQPLPLSISLDAAKVKLGQQLFRDPRLSADDHISCLSCHHLDRGGADHKPFSVGVNNTPGQVNALTIYNAAFNSELTWTGKFETIEAFTQAVMENPIAMGIQWQVLLPKLRQVKDYAQAFSRIYPDGMTIATVVDALSQYQRSLYTPNARFDQYLRGNQTSLSREEQEGYRLFKAYGCVSCHQGMNIGGNVFQKIGTMAAYLTPEAEMKQANLGRYTITNDPADRFVFRVPSLRNVALTAPYFHDGSAPNLESAITIMANYQLGRSLSDQETASIAQFLKTLTGEHPELKQASN
jgi:cytochrome c peroxidase